MNNNNLGCGKRFKFVIGKLKEVVGDCDFICGVANAWGEERFCLKCDKKLRDGWEDNHRKIENIYKKNFEIIKKYNLKVGDKLTLKKQFRYFDIGKVITISHIHKLYGWILFEETGQLPQEAEELLKIIIVKDEMKGGNNNNDN